MFLTLRLQTPPIFAGRLTKMLGAVAAEITQRGEVHAVGDLGEREALVVQKAFHNRHGGAVDITADAVARHAFDRGGEVFRRDVQPLGIVAHLALGATDAGGEQVGQLTDDVGGAVAMGVGGLTASVELEDVIHHRQAEAPHHLTVEEQVAVVEAVAQAMEVLQQNLRLAVVELDDGVLVKADAAPDAVVVRRKQSSKELVVGGEPFHLHSRSGREVLGTGGIGHHHKVVFRYVVTFFVEHKTTFTSSANKMHTSVTQFWVIHSEEIRSVLKINLHGAKLRIISLVSAKYCGNCENSGAFCETYISLSRCNFAP